MLTERRNLYKVFFDTGLSEREQQEGGQLPESEIRPKKEGNPSVVDLTVDDDHMGDVP